MFDELFTRFQTYVIYMHKTEEDQIHEVMTKLACRLYNVVHREKTYHTLDELTEERRRQEAILESKA